ncbi:MAG TPA: FHA domain-containing protein [Polyangiaceae bacterium]
MALTVLVRSGDSTKPATITFDAPRIVLGRGEGCEVFLPDPSVSQRHASIRQRGTDYVVIDEGSTNGTFVGPVRLSPHAPRVLRSGDLVRVGRIWLEIRIEQARVTDAQMQATREIALDLVSSALAAEGEAASARVRVVAGPDADKTLVLGERERSYIVGRGAHADLVLSDEDLSRRHVELGRRGLNLVVKELGSKNGTTLDGKPLEKGVETIWPPGAVLASGQTQLAYEDPVRAALEAIAAAPDERMRESDVVEPPAGVELPELPAASATVPPVSRAPAEAQPVASRRGGLRLLDFLVALVALAVLGVSLLGLWWLFGS